MELDLRAFLAPRSDSRRSLAELPSLTAEDAPDQVFGRFLAFLNVGERLTALGLVIESIPSKSPS